MAVISVTDVLYEPVQPSAELPYVLRVYLIGTGFHHRSAPVVGAIGDEPLEAVVLDEAGGAAGFLGALPSAGDTVRVGYLDTGLEDTEFTFPTIPNA